MGNICTWGGGAVHFGEVFIPDLEVKGDAYACLSLLMTGEESAGLFATKSRMDLCLSPEVEGTCLSVKKFALAAFEIEDE